MAHITNAYSITVGKGKGAVNLIIAQSQTPTQADIMLALQHTLAQDTIKRHIRTLAQQFAHSEAEQEAYNNIKSRNYQVKFITKVMA